MIKIKNIFLLSSIFLLNAYYILQITKYKETNNALKQSNAIPKEIKKDYFYFLQITDTHLSDTHNKKEDKQFYKFLSEITNLNYEFIIHTGDIFHSQGKNFQTKKENYLFYKTITQNKRIFNLKGNHDNFKTTNEKSKEIENIIYNGNKENRVIYLKNNDKLILIRLLDTNPNFGLPKFYNFFSVLSESYYEYKNDLSINMCHYPMNVTHIMNNHFKKCDAWFSGHFHSFFGYGIINKRKERLESVLRDFFSKSVYRIICIYKGNMSFNDVFLYKPKICIFNPTDVNLGIKKEKTETELKFIAVDYEEIKVEVDDKIIEGINKEGELHSLNLPKYYKKIKVTAKNKFGIASHEIFLEKKRLSSIPLDIPFFIIPIFLVILYFIFFIISYLILPNKFFIFVLSNGYNTFLPTAFIKAHDNSFVPIYSTKAGLSNTFDVFYFHTVLCCYYDLFLLISLYYEVVFPFVLCYFGSFLFFWYFWGFFFRPLEDFTFSFLIFLYFRKQFMKKKKTQIK